MLSASGFAGADYRFGDTSLTLELGGTLVYDRTVGSFWFPHLSFGINFHF